MRVGDRVIVKSNGNSGVISFVGRIDGKPGTFIGVHLDHANGKNDGSVDGVKYFSCPKNHGIFVREENLSIHRDDKSSFAASKSHELNDAYMENFERGFKALGRELPKAETKSSSRAGKNFDQDSFAFAYQPSFQNQYAWERGPRNPQGLLFEVSDRPLLCACISPDGREFVVGGSDHSLRVFDLMTGKRKRELYTKKSGHSEWVTGCAYTKDGTILSIGMDNKMCLWRGVQATDFIGHHGSLSKLLVNSASTHALTASYDKTVRIWNLQRKQEDACILGHKGPIMEMQLLDGYVITGSRDSHLRIVDIMTLDCVGDTGDHEGQVSALETSQTEPIYYSGDQKGTVRMWDLRSGIVAQRKHCIHPGGSVNALRVTFDGMVVSAGADNLIHVLDPRSMSDPILTFASHKDFIYSMEIADRFILSGAGDGMLLVHDIQQGKLVYGLGANQAGVRSILVGNETIVTAGDDGTAMAYQF